MIRAFNLILGLALIVWVLTEPGSQLIPAFAGGWLLGEGLFGDD